MKFPTLTLSGSLAHRRCSTNGSFSGMGLGKSWGRQLPRILPVSLYRDGCPASRLGPESPGSKDRTPPPTPGSQPLLSLKASVALRSPRDSLELDRPSRDVPDRMGHCLAFWEDGGIAHSSQNNHPGAISRGS